MRAGQKNGKNLFSVFKIIHFCQSQAATKSRTFFFNLPAVFNKNIFFGLAAGDLFLFFAMKPERIHDDFFL